MALFIAGLFIPQLRATLMLHAGSFGVDGAFWPGVVSYMFVHSGLSHLLANILFLAYAWQRGSIEYGLWRVAAVYAVGGLAGGIAFIAASLRGDTAGLCGASAGVLALCGSLLPAASATEQRLDSVKRQLPPAVSRWLPARIRMRTLVAIIIISTLLSNPGVQPLAVHIAGVAAGFAMGFLFCRGRMASESGGSLSQEYPALIDKVRQSGYSSLSADERRILNCIGSRSEKAKNGFSEA